MSFSKNLLRSFSAIPLAGFVGGSISFMDGEQKQNDGVAFHQPEFHMPNTNSNDFRIHQPSFSATSFHTKPKSVPKPPEITIDSLTLISGSANPKLSEEVSKEIKVPLLKCSISRFADGEVCVQLNENIRGKDVFIVQSCVAPVNDSIMELLLTISTCRRASAKRIVAVIPYFGYKHHRRSNNLSFKHNSRFLTSGAGDFATMLQELGVDRVISVDLQRPGQGLEACFFDNMIPVETVITTEAFVKYLLNVHEFKQPVTIIAPNAEVYKKAKNFKRELEKFLDKPVALVPYFSISTESGPSDVEQLNASEIDTLHLKGGDVIIVDDMVDTGATVQSLSTRLNAAGAGDIIVCASHGLFTEHAMEIIDSSKVTKIVVTDSLPLPKNSSKKIVQLPLAPFLADMILTEHFRTVRVEEDKFEDDEESS